MTLEGEPRISSKSIFCEKRHIEKDFVLKLNKQEIKWVELLLCDNDKPRPSDEARDYLSSMLVKDGSSAATGYQGHDDDDDEYILHRTMMMMIWIMKLTTHVYMKKTIAELQQSQHKSRKVWKMITVTVHIGNLHAPRNIWTMFQTSLPRSRF